MSRKYLKINFITIFFIFHILNIAVAQENLLWPCGQYVTRQEAVSGTSAPFKSVINVLYTQPNGTVGLDKVCENTSHLFNAAVFYEGYIWAWKQYTSTSQSGSTNKLMRINNNCTVTEYTMSITGAYNNAYVDNAGNMYIGNTGTAPNFTIYKFDLNSLNTIGTNEVQTIAVTPAVTVQGFTSFPGGFGDMYFDGTNAYIWNNQQGLARIDYNAAGTSATYTRIGTGNTNETVGSLFINSADPGFLYGYGSSAANGVGNSPQNTIVKIDLTNGTYTDVAAGGASVSQSDGAGCATATFEEPDPVANPDESLDNTKGSTVTVSPITGNDVVVGGTINITTVNMVPPANATNIVTDPSGDIISFEVPNEGTWVVSTTTGNISFDPLSTFTGNPSVINYNVKDDKGNRSNTTTVTITYLETLPVELNKFSAKLLAENIILTWKTSSEKNFSHFEVQSSVDASEFGTKGTVNSGISNIYNFTDLAPHLGANYYRLKMVDLDGSYKYSNILNVNYKKDSEFVNIQNPVKNGFIELFTNYKNFNLVLMNSSGQKFNVQKIEVGNNSYGINVSNVTSGVYYLIIVSESNIATKKILIYN